MSNLTIDKVLTKEVKQTLINILREDDEFKRYILLSMWLQQFYTTTIVNTFKDVNNQVSDTESIYNTFNILKKQLINKNKQLQHVYDNMTNQHKLLLLMNNILELHNENEVEEYANRLTVIRQMIDKNESYISRINNLSASKIDEVTNAINNKSN